MAVFFIYAKMGPEREIIVKFKQGIPQSKIEDIGRDNKFVFVKRLEGMENSYICRVEENQDVAKIVHQLNQNPDIAYAEANQKVKVLNTAAGAQGSGQTYSSAASAVGDAKDHSITN